jgi:hypothetical protein
VLKYPKKINNRGLFLRNISGKGVNLDFIPLDKKTG